MTEQQNPESDSSSAEPASSAGEQEPSPSPSSGAETADAPASAPEAVAVAADAPVPSEEEKEEKPKIPFSIKEKKEEPGSVLRYVVEVERGDYDAKLDGVFSDLKKTVIIDGFRKGRAPVKLLKIRFGKDAEEDVLKEMAANIAGQIVESDSLDAVGDPDLHESKVEEGKPAELQIDIDVHPKIDLKDYTGIEVEVETEEVDDQLVDRQLEEIRQSNATYEEPEEPKAYEEGDGVTVDVEVTNKSGQRVESECQENAFLRNPHYVLGDDVADDLQGKRGGDSFTTTVERTTTTRAGKEVTYCDTYHITVREVKVRVVPELDDEFAKDVGDFESLADLRKRILDNSIERAERRKRSSALEKIFERVIEANSFEAPRRIVAAQEYQTMIRDSEMLHQSGLDLTAIGLTQQSYLDETKENSERLVKTHLLINAIVDKEKLEVTDEDMEKEIERMAEEAGRKPMAIRARLEAEKRLDALKRDLMVEKVGSFLVENNTIIEVAPKSEEEPKREEQDRKREEGSEE